MTNLADAQEHVPETKWNNYILYQHICTTYHGIPYTWHPHTAICYRGMETAAKLYYFPAKGGCSKYYSLREILHHVKLNYKKHLSMLLIGYILTHNEPTLTNTIHACAWIVFSYALYKTNRVGMNVIISPLTRSLHDLMSLSFPQPPQLL